METMENLNNFEIVNSKLKKDIETLDGKKPLNIGVDFIEPGEIDAIGPLAGCDGMVIPTEKGSIIAHIQPDFKKSKTTWEELNEILQQKELKNNEVFLFVKNNNDNKKIEDPIYKNRMEFIYEFLKIHGLSNIKIIAYQDDHTYVFVNTETREILSAPLKPKELTLYPTKQISQIKY